jgi:ABC-type branched-subunit amino acid transport system ATPase component
MDITLPAKMNGQTPDTLKGVKEVTIIGANGSGKTRFCDKMIENCGDNAYRLSALRAIFPIAVNSTLKGSIDDIFDRINNMPQVKSLANTEFDKLTYIMMHDEFLDLMGYKAHLLMNEEVPFPKTKLDQTVKMWQEVFPKNKVLRENGKLLFSTEGNDDKYSSLRLSDGEKAVLYYIGATLYAMPNAMIFIDDPETFMHHSIMQALWNVIEEMRPDCTFIYNTHDIDFATSRIDNRIIWVKNFDPQAGSWDYELLERGADLSDGLYMDILGTRKPVLFIEGDSIHSIDSRLYPLVFPDYTIKPLGSCNKVIEAVRSFNDLRAFHHLDSHGIVDRDRRSDKEVQYLRDRKILVPNVAEIENILMLDDVVRTVAKYCRRNENDVFFKVKRAVINMFDHELKQQALMHVRHRVKMDVEKRVDMRFTNIGALEDHMSDLVNEINPRGLYENICRQFHSYVESGDYRQVLRVFNQKTMLPESNVAGLCGLSSKEDYINTVLKILRADGEGAQVIRHAVKDCFGLTDDDMQEPEAQPTADKTA